MVPKVEIAQIPYHWAQVNRAPQDVGKKLLTFSVLKSSDSGGMRLVIFTPDANNPSMPTLLTHCPILTMRVWTPNSIEKVWNPFC